VNRIIAHVTNQRFAGEGLLGQLQYAHFYSQNLSIIQSPTFSTRENCAYEYASTTFTCSDFSFQAMMTGVDDYGYLYQRIRPVSCTGGRLARGADQDTI